jgi:hypothetical protein
MLIVDVNFSQIAKIQYDAKTAKNLEAVSMVRHTVARQVHYLSA